MSLARTLASVLLDRIVRHASPESQGWGNAMRRELDFIESDWTALLWALGSATALFKHSVPRQVKERFEKRFGPAGMGMLRNIRKKAVGTLWGVVMATVVLTISVLGLLRLAPALFPAWQLEHPRIVEWLAVVGVPEAVFVVAAVAFWRNKRSMATGILFAAMTLMTHAIVHAMIHG
jgi:hypothetical protein